MLVESLYTVVAGDTISSIANSNKVKAEVIIERNNIDDINHIKVGDSLIILKENSKSEIDTKMAYENDLNLTEKDKVLLTQLVYSEANNQSEDGKKAVVDVVINRMLHESYPDSVEEIILQKGQFVNSEKISTLPITENNRQAVDEALNSIDSTNGALFFWNPELSKSAYMASLETVAIIGDHEFLK